MKISNVRYEFRRNGGIPWLADLRLGLAAGLEKGTYPLRLSIVEVGADGFAVEATLVRYGMSDRYAAAFANIEILNPKPTPVPASPFVAVQVVPTGVRCEFGGYAGDAAPVTNLLARAVDRVVANPNAVNASDLNEMADNVLYVEGKTIDDFLLGHVGLSERRSNRIGTFIDPTGASLKHHVVNCLNAARATAGIVCGSWTLLGRDLDARIEWSRAGCAVGTVAEPDAILEAAALLIGAGADAIGGVSVIHGVTAEMFSDHMAGRLPNPSGGIEAIITHLISKVFRVPAAHAPLPYYAEIKRADIGNPRAAAEFISTPHYFSVLKGLARAPQPIELGDTPPAGCLTLANVGAVVMPASCLGGVPALAAEFARIPLIAVRENETILNVTNAKMQMQNVIEVATYLEAAGVLLALRSGISLESLRRPLAIATEIPAIQRGRLADETASSSTSQGDRAPVAERK
jgi:hypothetical protein